MLQSKSMARPAALRKLLITTMILACHSVAAFAAPDIRVDIAAQPLSSALRDLASQAGVQLVFAAETVGAAKARAIKGEMSVDAALRKLLVGSGLEFRQDGDNSYVIVRSEHSENVLPEMVVTATRTERAVDEVPASVSVIGRKELAQRNLNNLQEYLRTVEGVEAGQLFSVPHASSIDIRGVGGSYSAPTSKVLLDGMNTDAIVSQVQGNGGLNFLSPWDVEQVEVVRGPASALYGPEVVGGVVNLIPKRWRGDMGGEIHAGYGSHDTSRVGAAMGSAGEIGDFRISTYSARSDGFIAQRQPDTPGGMISVDLAPRNWTDKKNSFTGALRPSERQEVTFAYQDFATHSFTMGGHPNRYLNLDGQTWTVGYRHELGDSGSIKAGYRETRLDQRFGFDNEYLWGTPGDLGLAAKGAKSSNSSEFNLQVDWNITPDNTVIAGYSRSTGEFELNSMFGNVDRNKSTVDGLYIQDEARMGSWKLVMGGRQDYIRMYGDTENGVETNPSSSVSVFNPRLGAQYEWNDSTSLYASAGTAYVPATNSAKFLDGDVPNSSLKPEKSVSYEIGLRTRQKYGDFKLAVFHTLYQDKINRVEIAPGVGQNQNIDRVEVLGVELGWKARFREAWNPFLNYSYTDSTIKADVANPQNVGTRMPQTSVHKLNLGLLYAPGGDWSASVSSTLRSSQYVRQWYCPTNNTNTYECHLDGYFTADARLTRVIRPFGDKSSWNAWIAVNNLGDKHYRQYYPFEYSDGRTWTVGIDGKF
ncbi:MAG: irgA 2 [Proteobacteria bacterium]|nr:irgA 2 [Pseudomonadota bacterium]